MSWWSASVEGISHSTLPSSFAASFLVDGCHDDRRKRTHDVEFIILTQVAATVHYFADGDFKNKIDFKKLKKLKIILF